MIPVRSQFGPLEAPVVSTVKLEVKEKKATTVWKKKNAVQKSMETSAPIQNNDLSDANQTSADLQSPIIANVRSLHTKGNHSVGAEVAISSIQQQLMSITSQSISQSGIGDSNLLSLQGGLNQLPLQATPLHNHSSLNQLQQSLQDLPGLSFSGAPGNIQLTPENLHNLAQQYHATYGHSDLSTVQHSLNFNDFVTSTPLHHSVGSDQSANSLLLSPPLEGDNQSAEDSGVVDTTNVNTSDSTATDVTSDTELEDSIELDMSFEFKVCSKLKADKSGSKHRLCIYRRIFGIYFENYMCSKSFR